MDLFGSPWNILASLLFSSIGFIIYRFAKKNQNGKMMITGIILMLYSYFTSTTAQTWFFGFSLCCIAYYFKDADF